MVYSHGAFRKLSTHFLITKAYGNNFSLRHITDINVLVSVIQYNVQKCTNKTDAKSYMYKENHTRRQNVQCTI